MKKVVFIRGANIFCDSRSTKEIMALAEAGYYVEVLGWDRSGIAAENCKKVFASLTDSINLRFYNARVEDGIGLKSIGKLFGWLKWVVKTLQKIENIYAVHACDLDTGIAAYQFCKKNKVKLVYDIFDYYVDSHNIPSILRNTVEQMEIKTINFANVTIICTEERKEQIDKATPKKLVVIHNSPEMPEIPITAEKDLDYVYCGGLSDRRLIFEILDEYENNSELKITFAGSGSYSTKAADVAKKYPDFNFLGLIPFSEVLSVEARARVLSAIYEPTIRNHRLCAPNKFYEALALGKPLIVCKGTGIDKIVQENEIGYVIDYDAKQFYEALHKLTASPELCDGMGARARRLYEEKYNWTKMKKILLDMYSEL